MSTGSSSARNLHLSQRYLDVDDDDDDDAHDDADLNTPNANMADLSAGPGLVARKRG